MIFKQLADYVLYMVMPYLKYRFALWSRGLKYTNLFSGKEATDKININKSKTVTDEQLASEYRASQKMIEKDYILRLKKYYEIHNPTMIYKVKELITINLKQGGLLQTNELFNKITNKYNSPMVRTRILPLPLPLPVPPMLNC